MTTPADIPGEIWEQASILMDQHRQIEDDLEYTARIIMWLKQEQAVETPPRYGLTVQQLTALAFLEGKCLARVKGAEVSPSMREIARHLDVSLSQAHALVTALEDRGHVRRLPGRARSISIVARH